MIRLNQRGRDLRRVIASITAYLAIGALAAGALWVSLAIIVNTAHDMMGR